MPIIEIKASFFSASYFIDDRLSQDESDGGDRAQDREQRERINNTFATLDLRTVTKSASGFKEFKEYFWKVRLLILHKLSSI